MLVYTNIMKIRLKAPERRKVILEAASSLFARRGFAGMTTAAVAKASRVAEPILYRHFPSKRALVHVLLKDVVAKVTGVLKSLVARHGDPVEALREFCREYPAIAREHDREFRVINRALAELEDEKSRALLREHYDAYHTVISALIEDGQKRGKLRADIKASTGAWHLINTALGFLLTKELRAPSQADSAYESGVAEAALSGLLA
jgi:TetR/AcrR family transcriptional regulator